ncbi:MAG: tetratricopeptide repeat protein, partial [Hymenobacter sp.]|nr:tetratricopeptide repeat protein [Hymenobacter sp.]
MTHYSILRLLAAPAVTFLLAAGLSGCASERRGMVGRAYNNMAARDNGYFLAREKLREVETKLYQARQNDYNRVLPLFPTMDEATVTSIATELEDVVKKASLPIQYRSASDWTDDAYVLIGKTRYYKMEYEDAAKTLKYVNSTSKDPDAKHEALIWLMRTFLATKELESAKAVSDVLDKEEGREANAKELFLTRAEYYLRTDEPLKAIENLEKAVPLVEPKNERSRTRYILAQLYQAQGDDKKAYAELNKILKKNPPYELDFYSKLMLGQVSDLNNDDKARLDKYFAKLLKDTKNKEYRDKIYYEMARLSYRQQRYDEALALLQKSARAPSANRAQKSYTYLLAGRIYYENLQKYRLAATYYDSTVQNLAKDAPDFAAVSERAGILKDFAQQFTTIETQDSLQALARLDTVTLRTRLTAYADTELETRRKAAEALTAQLERDQERENSRQTSTGLSTSRDLQTDINPEDFVSGSTGPKWYFDNPTALSTARAEFIRKWGDRPLQDNWRTVRVASSSPVSANGGNVPVSITGANKTSVTAGATTELGRALADADPAVQRKALVAQYRQALPLTSAQLAASNKLVEEAMFALGGIYNQQLREPLPAIQTYEKLLPRFPASPHTPEIYYSLYLIFKEQKQPEMAENYALGLRQEFPNSAYARLVADPEYLRRTSLVNKEVAVRVDSAFVLYKNQDFKKASALLARTAKKFPESDLNDRIAFQNALIDLRTQPPLTAKASLEKFLKDYEQSPLGGEARTLLSSYKKYETGGIAGALASTQKPTVSMFRPGEVNNRVRIIYDADVTPTKTVVPAAPAPKAAPAAEQPKLPAGSLPPPTA